MLSFYEIVNQHQMNVENEVCDLYKQIGDILRIFNEYHINNDTVESYNTNFESNTRQYAEYSQRFLELDSEPRTPAIEVELDACIKMRDKMWQIINQNILSPFQNVFILLNDAQRILIENVLGKWKRDQILFLYGEDNLPRTKQMVDNLGSLLDQIQTHFEKLFELVWYTRELLSKIHDCHFRANFVGTLAAEAHGLNLILQKMLLAGFVIFEHPEQVIHKDKRFKAKVRVLLSKYITQIGKPLVSILSESQVKQQHQHHKQQQEQDQWLTPLNEKLHDIPYPNFAAFPLPCDNLEFDLTDMRLTTIARTPLMGAMDEKFAIQFRCSLKIKNELQSDIWTTSVPDVVTTNVSQDAEGWATITWDNSFFATDRDPFTVPESVPWSHMKWVLSTRFFYQTGCHLNEQHLQYLYKKVFGLPYDPSGDNRFISWHQFAKDKGTRKFTFFTWFYEITKLIRSHLSKEWENGLIEGFISMDEASEKLKYSKPGTFLLRFSDSTPGGISVASYTTIDNVLGIHHMTPYVRSDFDIKKPPCTIGDFIKDLFYYTHLFPNLEKDTVFCFYYTPPKRQSGPYGPKKW